MTTSEPTEYGVDIPSADLSDIPEPPEPEEITGTKASAEAASGQGNPFVGKLWRLPELLQREFIEDWIIDGLFIQAILDGIEPDGFSQNKLVGAILADWREQRARWGSSKSSITTCVFAFVILSLLLACDSNSAVRQVHLERKNLEIEFAQVLKIQRKRRHLALNGCAIPEVRPQVSSQDWEAERSVLRSLHDQIARKSAVLALIRKKRKITAEMIFRFTFGRPRNHQQKLKLSFRTGLVLSEVRRVGFCHRWRCPCPVLKIRRVLHRLKGQIRAQIHSWNG